jgi:hypothetical protein
MAGDFAWDLDLQRRTINVNRTPGTEVDLWKGFNERHDHVYRQLLLLAEGHPPEMLR